MLSYRNGDGGWGYVLGSKSNSLDTALTLHALKASNYTDSTLLYQAINFLTTNQHSDGGWGFTTNDPSNAYVTAIVLRALSGYSSQFSVQSSIQSASAYLLTKQNTDGGFGSSPSTVYETALSIMSLIESGKGTAQALQSGITYLTTTQLPNGSWNDDPYSTALALQALANVRPNLQLSSLTLSKPMPREGEDVTITALVANNGLEDATGVVVRFYSGDPSAGGVQIGTDQVIPSIARGSSLLSSITTSFAGTGAKTISAVFDPDNLISESNENDNKTSARLWVATGPDLAVLSDDLKPSSFVPTPGTAFTLEYKLRNLGESETGAFDVALYDGDPASGGALIQTDNLSGINGLGIRTETIGVTLNGNGSHTLYLVADSGSVITEISEANNTGSVTVTVGGTLTVADLIASPSDITLTPARPLAGDTVQISVRIRNQGAEAANSFTAELYDGAPESGGVLIASQTLSLAAGGEQTITTNWLIPTGIHDVHLVLDRTNQVLESSESNNRASARVMTDMVDLSISATDLVFTPAHPVVNDMVSIMITDHNTGIQGTGAFNLALYDGDPAAGGVLLQTFPVSNIAADSDMTVSYSFAAQPKTYRFYVVADAENQVTELYEDNNLAIRSLKIKSPGETLGPDLVPYKFDLSDTATDAQTLAISGNAHITVQNKGDDKVATSFDVLVFEDMDGDGRYTAGVDNALGTGTLATGPTTSIPAIWPEGAGLVDVQLSGHVKFLHSPLYALVDSGDAILEQDEANNFLISCKDCEVVPSNPIQPALKWQWGAYSCTDNVTSPPIVAFLHDDNGDGKINDNDTPYILFITPDDFGPFYYGWCGGSQGILHAVNGKTGQELFKIRDTNFLFDKGAFIAVADINNDGKPEIIVPNSRMALFAFRNDGTLLWDNYDKVVAWNQQSPSNDAYIGKASVPAIADIDGDNKPEIIVGRVVFNNDGSVRRGSNNDASRGYWGQAEVADIDMDGKLEIIAGNSVYSYDGGLKWINSALSDGLTAVGNINNEQHPEITYATTADPTYSTGGTSAYLLDYLGNIKWGPVYVRLLEPTDMKKVYPSSPVIADFDGDGELEIGLLGYTKFVILDKQGILKQSLSISPHSGGNNVTATVFDLDGDGRPEVILNAGFYFRIFDGKSGSLLYEQIYGGLNSKYQNAIVADVDGDGHAEIVVVGGDYSTGSISQAGVRVYGAKNNNWVGSRKIWNQAGYHVTNVNDDGTIPQHEAPSWLLNNTYRTQADITSDGTGSNPYSTPNLTASYLRVDQAGSTVNLAVRIGNGGAIASGPSVTVLFYDGDPAAGGTIIGSAATSRTLQPGECQDVIYSWAGGSLGLHHIYATVNTGSGAISECRTDDNQTSADITLQTEYADVAIGPQDITPAAGPYYEGLVVPVTVLARNIGAMTVTNPAVRMYYGSPTAGGVQIGPDQVIPSLGLASAATLVFNYDTLGKSGTNIIYFVVDPANMIAETTKANNSASFSMIVQPPVVPNIVLASGDVSVTPASPQEGQMTTITATVHNLGASTGGVPVPVRFYLGDPSAGGALIGEQGLYSALDLGQTAAVQLTADTAGWAGQQTIVAVADPLNTIAESKKDDNKASATIFVQPAGLTASIALDRAVYAADDAMTITLSAVDSLNSARSLALDISIRDGAGNRIAWISQTDPVALGPSGTIVLNRTWNTAATLAGPYTVLMELSESGRIVARKTAGFSISADDRVTARVTTDKISYNPNESAAITAVITSQSRNRIFENLTAVMTVGSQQSAVFSETRTISTLMPGATFTFKGYWNTGAYAPGTYPISLEVRDAAGMVVAAGSQNLVISAVVKPSTALRGSISVDKQSIMAGDPVSAFYRVSNVGNLDLASVTLALKTVHVKNQTVYGTLTETISMPLKSSVTSTQPIDTASYAAMDYLVVLQASINGGPEETIAGSYFRVEGAPTVPALSAPANGSDVQTLLPVLIAGNAADPNDDKLTYEFELYADSGLTRLIASAGGIAPGAGTTAFPVPAELTENSFYFWRSRAYDGKLYGDWMHQASFRVNMVNDPPTAPTIAGPANNTEVSSLTPVLTVNNASDPDSESLTYNFLVALDSACTQTVVSVIGVSSGQGSTAWQVTPALSENTWYYWCGQADDWLITGPWSSSARFFVNSSNEAPTVPVILSPANNCTIAGVNTDIVLQNSTDADSPVISYYFEVDTVPTFDSGSTIRSGIIPAGPGTTAWQAIGLLDNTQYYVRAMASDGNAGCAWTQAISIFVNTANDAPTTPTIANPSIGAGVNVFTPTFSVHNATDLDHDALTYEFEVYSDAAFTNLVDRAAGIAETPPITSWTATVSLTENQTYYWRSRAFDGSLNSGWTSGWFVVNTANDAPGSVALISPLNGSTLATLSSTFTFQNAVDPDSDQLTYELAVYSAGNTVASVTGIQANLSGQTSVALQNPLADNTTYQWSVRAFDGDRYGPWAAQESFTVHVSQTGITVDLELEPETLNQQSNGNWVMAEIELPHGYKESDVDISSIRLEGTVLAVAKPYEQKKRHHDHGCDADHSEHDHGEIKVKFSRSAVIAVLPAGDHVPVHVTGTVAGTHFEGVDFIRVIH